MTTTAIKSLNLVELVNGLRAPLGVFKPNEGSIALAETAMQQNGYFLDLGTGSGFVAIVLSLQGKNGVASDASKRALECALENFNRFGVSVPLIQSDLYSNIYGKYDFIAFNPSINPNETEFNKALNSIVLSVAPERLRNYLSSAYQHKHAADRRTKLIKFVDMSHDYINHGGVLLLNALNQDVDYLETHHPVGCTITVKKTTSRTSVLELKYN